MSRYDVLLFLHIVGAIVWVGIGLTGHALAVWAYRKHEWTFFAKLQEGFGSLEAPAGILGPLLLLGTGIGLVADGPWGFTGTWVVIGLAGFGAALFLGIAFQGPGMRRFNEIVRERETHDPEAIAVGRRLNALMWPELAILATVLLAMATKPTGWGSVGFWISAATILGGAFAMMIFELVAGKRGAERGGPTVGPASRSDATESALPSDT